MPRTNTPSDNHDEVDLLQAARIEIGSAEDVLSAFTAVLRLICERTGSKIGQMWMPNEEGTALERRAVWPTNGNGSVKKFIAASGRMTFPRDAGLPGRI